MKKRWSIKYDSCQNPDHDFYKGGDSPHDHDGNCKVCSQRELMRARRAKKKQPCTILIHGKPVGQATPSDGSKVLEYFLERKPILQDIRRKDVWIKEINQFMKDMGVEIGVMKRYANYLVNHSWIADKNSLCVGHLYSRPVFVEWLSNYASKLPPHIEKINKLGEDYLKDPQGDINFTLLKVVVFAEDQHMKIVRDIDTKELINKLKTMPLYDALLEMGWKDFGNKGNLRGGR